MTNKELEKRVDELEHNVLMLMSRMEVVEHFGAYKELAKGESGPATDEPKCKFKVGDKVKNINPQDPNFDEIGYVHFCCPTNNNKKDDMYFVKFEKNKPFANVQFSADLEPYTEPRWTFTDDEKVILRNLPEEYKWIARDKNNRLSIHFEKPIRYKNSWNGGGLLIDEFNHLFQSIKWEDTEACEFRKYL